MSESDASQSVALAAPDAWSDWLGMVASIGCAIHCAAMPFVIAYLPTLGLSFLAEEGFHQWMAVICFAIALFAFVPGLRKHGRWTPVMVGSVGLAMITVAAFGFAGECCPTCRSESVVADSGGVAGCTEQGCPFCEEPKEIEEPKLIEVGASAEALPASSSSEVNVAVNSLTERFVPWLTPMGGLVLVSAHLLNRRYGCRCGCCVGESSEEVLT